MDNCGKMVIRGNAAGGLHAAGTFAVPKHAAYAPGRHQSAAGTTCGRLYQDVSWPSGSHGLEGGDPNISQLQTLDQGKTGGMIWVWVNTYRYIFSGMNIHLPAILGFTRGTRF